MQDHEVLHPNTSNQIARLHYCIRWPLLEDSLWTRTPVKIRRFTCTADQAKLIINDMTDISQPSPTEYCFQYVELSTNKCTMIADILQNSSEGDSVSVLGKVGNISEVSTIHLGKQSPNG